MTDKEIIKKAVSLADGWEIHSEQTFGTGISGTSFLNTNQVGRDALAAQLVRQRYQDDPDATVIYEQDVMTTIRKLVDDS